MEQLETVERTAEDREINFPPAEALEMHNPYPLLGQKVTIQKGGQLLLDNVSFQFPLGRRIRIVGPNGSGKSSLLEHIIKAGEGITLSKKVIFSIYRQMDYQLEGDLSLVDYLMRDSDYEEAVVRSVLHQLGFEQEEASKKTVENLSGGEAARLVIAKLFTDPSNVLVLDEPTNFIDIDTIQALESLMKSYEGTILFTSHDRYFLENTAQQIWRIEDKKLELLKY